MYKIKYNYDKTDGEVFYWITDENDNVVYSESIVGEWIDYDDIEMTLQEIAHSKGFSNIEHC